MTKAIIFFVTWSNLGKLRTLQDGHHSINVDSYNVLYYIYIPTHWGFRWCGGWPYSIYIHGNHVLTMAYMISIDIYSYLLSIDSIYIWKPIVFQITISIYNLFEEKTSGRPTKKTKQIARPGLPWLIIFWKKDSSSFWWSWWWWWWWWWLLLFLCSLWLVIAYYWWQYYYDAFRSHNGFTTHI